tara:strand:+ start:10253 stop:10882 length:630 start_codon:yes stop_codon:yes gene_type:complete
MKIHDISLTISEDMAVYKDKQEKKPKIDITRTMDEGSNESKFHMESHTGTHADAPYHMLDSGKKLDKLELEPFIGNCIVLDLTNSKDSIKKEDLEDKKTLIEKGDIVLLKTKNKSENKFDFNFTYLDKSSAEYISKLEIKSVGIDNLGIERAQPEHETHIILFKKGIQIIEGLDLSKIKQGRYFFIGLPLKIKDGDGSPIRAVLIEDFS